MRKLAPLIYFMFPVLLWARDYTPESRLAYLESSLAAHLESSEDTLNNAALIAMTLGRGSCRSAYLSLKLQCLIAAFERYCAEKKPPTHRTHCLFHADVLIANLMGQTDLTSHFNRSDSGLRRAKRLSKSLTETGLLTAEFYLSRHLERGNESPSSLAKGMDSFCREQSDYGRLTWQTCVSVLIWFIGSTR